MRSELRDAVARIVELLVRGQYSEIERISGGKRLTAEEVGAAVRDYGRTLKSPPGGEPKLDVIQVANRTPPTWSVRCDLWTEEEGKSDLSLELTVIDAADGTVIEVDNLHVL